MTLVKKRPSVDPKIYDLARAWMSECYALTVDAEDAGDSIEDAVWDLANALQHEIENWLNDAEGTGRLRILQ